jgi:tetratricopeptide (TPR) repeat protein
MKTLWQQIPEKCALRSLGRVIVLFLVLTILGPATDGAAGAVEDRVRQSVDEAISGGLQPVDFHRVMLALLWRETFADWSTATRALDRLSGAPSIDPLMADELRVLRARLEMERGRDEAARQLFRTMGGLSSWWFHGPTPLEELEDFARLAQPPADGAQWRQVAGTDSLGWVGLSGLAWPPRRQMAYLATTVVSDSEQPVALRIGAAQAARAWLNGREVLTTPQPLRRAEDQAAAGGWLRAGRNTVVVAVAAEDEQWWLRARLTTPEGSPLDGVRELDERPAATEAVDREPPDVRDLESEIRREVDAGTPMATVALAAFLVAHSPEAVGGGGTRSACKAARDEAPGEARLLEWLVTSEPGAARDLLEEALNADPDLVWARLELAEWYGARGLYEQARALILEAERDDPSLESAALQLDSMIWGQVVLPEITEVARSAPRSLRANLALADSASSVRRWALVGEALDRLDGLTPGHEMVLIGRQRLAESCGDGAVLREIMSFRHRRDPNNQAVRMRLARLVAADGDADEARAILAAGIERSPGNVELLMELAGIEHAAGDDARALELAREVLSIRPQNRRAQRLTVLLGEEQEDLGWMRTAEQLWALVEQVPPATPAVVVLDHREIEFLPSNLTEERVQTAILITDGERAGDQLMHHLPFVPESDRLRVLAARILRRDGTEISARLGDTPRLSEPEFNIFYDTRLRVLRFEEFEDGDLVEIAYLRTETGESNETGPYSGGLIFVGREIPVALQEVELMAAEELMPSWELVHLDGEPTSSTDENGTRRVRWRWRNLEAVPTDVPPAPPMLVIPHLVFSNHPEWGDLADWYLRHVAPRVRVSQQVEDTAQRLVSGVDDRSQRIAKLYRFVTNEVRYVALEFGEHRFRPFSADWVLHHKIGDCKDKAALLVALLDAVDIPARMVMIRTSDLGPIANELAILEVFNHAIVYLPEDEMWLDGTASGHAPALPPAVDQGATAMVINGLDSRPETTPLVGAGLHQGHYTLARQDDGAVSITIRTEDTGEAADARRGRFAGSREPQRFARWLQESFPGAQLVGDPKLQLIPSKDPAIIEIEGVVASSSLAGMGGLRLYPGALEWSSRLVPSDDRAGPLVVAARPDIAWTLSVDLGRPPESVPEGFDLETEFGELRVETEAGSTGYRVEGYFHLEPGVLQAEQVPALREFLVTAERRLQRRVETP